MSLVVWLPLTKDLRQQGLDNITVTTTNTNNFQNEGKLSNKSLDVSGHYAFRVPSLVKKRVFSCAFWYKPITDSSLSDNWRRIIVFDTYTSDGSTTGAIFRFESSYGYQSSSTTYCISIHNNVGEPIASIGTGLGETDGWNKWQHIAITADGTTLKCYRNGVQVASGNMGNGGMLQGTVHIGYSGNRPVGRLNDFRLYDHCLSLMEIKELAKGLVLHYPLNRQGWGQENLLRGSNVIGSGTTIYGWVSNGSATGMEILSDGSLHYKYNVSNSKYIPSITTNTVIPCEFSKTYFYSMDLKFDKAITLGTSVPAHYWVGARNSDSITNTSCNGNLTGIQVQFISNHSGTLPANTWAHIITKFTFPAAATSSGYNYPAIRCFVYGSVLTETTTGEVNVWMKNCKVEEGSIETPWCPHVEDALYTTLGLNGTTEYDCSGFCNNGTRTGTLTWTSDTPKYAISTNFAAVGTIINNTSPIHLSNEFTIAWWGKINSWKKNWEGMFLLQNNATLNAGTNTYDIMSALHASTANSMSLTICQNGSSYAFDKYKWTYTIGVWAHYTCTYKAGVITIYQNGISIYTETITDNSSNDYYYRLGHRANFCDCQISDFRIYATALSASDVKSLYQNSAYIDSSGNVYGAVHTEV